MLHKPARLRTLFPHLPAIYKARCLPGASFFFPSSSRLISYLALPVGLWPSPQSGLNRLDSSTSFRTRPSFLSGVMEDDKRKKQKLAHYSEDINHPKYTTPNVDTTTYPYVFDTLTVSNLESTIPELHLQWYLGHLNIAVHFSNHSRQSFQTHFQLWKEV